MKNIKHIFIITVLIMNMLGICVYAADAGVGIFDENGRSTLSGNTGNGAAVVSVSVFNEGFDYQDADNMVADALVYANQFTANEDGSFEIVLNMSKYPTGEYTLSVTIGGKSIANKNFLYAKKDDNRLAIEGLNDAAKNGSTQLMEFIASNRKALEFKSDYDNAGLKDTALSMIASAAPFDTEDKKKCVNTYRLAMIAQAFEEKIITDIRTAEIGLEFLNQQPLSTVYKEKYITDTVKNNIAAKISGFAPYESAMDFKSAVYDSFVLSVVKNPTGSGDISTVIKALYPDFPQELLTDAICRAVSGKDYESIESLKKAMQENKAVNNYPQRPGGGGSSGGSDSSGGGGGGAPFTAVSDSNGTFSDTVKEQNVPNVVFCDISGVPWAVESIESLATNGIVSGREEGKFYPDDSVTREELVKILVLLFDVNSEVESGISFSDVKNDAWYYPYIRTAYEAGVVKGISDTLFGSGRSITRQDAAVMLYNCISDKLSDTEPAEAFLDEDEIAFYAVDAVKCMRALGIISGYEDGSFRPSNSITRAEAAKIMYTAEERMRDL